MPTRAVAVGLAVVLSACAGDDGSAPLCPSGLICHAPVDASIDATIDAPSAPADAFVCTDLNLEPNDSLAQAFPTPVASAISRLIFAGLTVCTPGDKDFYQVDITQAGQSLEALIVTDGVSPTVEGVILDSAGTTLATTAPVSSVVGTQRAYVANLAQGHYYVEAFAAATAVSAYRLTLTVTEP